MQVNTSKNQSHSPFAAYFFLLVEIGLIVLYGVFVEWGPSTHFINPNSPADVAEDSATTETLQTLYPIFQDVHVMMFVGFGFLMTYLKKHSWSSVGINFLLTAVSIQVYILSTGLWKRVFGDVSWSEKIHMLSVNLIQADFAAAAVLISFGGVLGKLSAFQLLFMAVIEVFLYAFNEELLYYSVQLQDVGGSIVIHTFGAYFGLAVSMMTTDKKLAKDHPDNSSNYTSNLFSMLGTLFLWMFWPSFNSALESGNGMPRTQISTMFSLIGSTLTTFVLSATYKNGKFHMEDILNATLAGGVAIGASANLIQNPFAAFVVGIVAGAISTCGFETLSGVLQKKIGLYDTAGIHNLHGMPGLLGGIVSSIFAAAMTDSVLGEPVTDYFNGRTAHKQGGVQIAGTFISLAIALGGGVVTGLLLRMKWLNPPKEYFNDTEFWVMEEEEPEIRVIPLTNHLKPGQVQLAEKEGFQRIESERGGLDGGLYRIQSENKPINREPGNIVTVIVADPDASPNKDSPSKALKTE